MSSSNGWPKSNASAPSAVRNILRQRQRLATFVPGKRINAKEVCYGRSLGPFAPKRTTFTLTRTAMVIRSFQPISWMTVKYVKPVNIIRLLLDRFVDSVDHHDVLPANVVREQTLDDWTGILDDLMDSESGQIFDDTSPMFELNVQECIAATDELTNLTMYLQPIFDQEVMQHLPWMYDAGVYCNVEHFDVNLALAYLEFALPHGQEPARPSSRWE